MYKSYRLKIENTNNGTRLTISDYQPIWAIVIEAAMIIGTLVYGFTVLKF